MNEIEDLQANLLKLHKLEKTITALLSTTADEPRHHDQLKAQTATLEREQAAFTELLNTWKSHSAAAEQLVDQQAENVELQKSIALIQNNFFTQTQRIKDKFRTVTEALTAHQYDLAEHTDAITKLFVRSNAVLKAAAAIEESQPSAKRISAQLQTLAQQKAELKTFQQKAAIQTYLEQHPEKQTQFSTLVEALQTRFETLQNALSQQRKSLISTAHQLRSQIISTLKNKLKELKTNKSTAVQLTAQQHTSDKLVQEAQTQTRHYLEQLPQQQLSAAELATERSAAKTFLQTVKTLQQTLKTEWLAENEDLAHRLQGNTQTKTAICDELDKLLKLEAAASQTAFNIWLKQVQLWEHSGPIERSQQRVLTKRYQKLKTAVQEKFSQVFTQYNATLKTTEAKRTQLITEVKTLITNITDYDSLIRHEKQLNALLKKWKLLKARGEQQNVLHKTFKQTLDHFFKTRKALIAAKLETAGAENIAKKRMLIEQLQTLHATQGKTKQPWATTKQQALKLLEHWKKTHPANKTESNALWKEFQTCLDALFNKHNEGFTANLAQKQQLLKKLETALNAFYPTTEAEAVAETVRTEKPPESSAAEQIQTKELPQTSESGSLQSMLQTIQRIQHSWNQAGPVPPAERGLEIQFTKLTKKFFNRENASLETLAEAQEAVIAEKLKLLEDLEDIIHFEGNTQPELYKKAEQRVKTLQQTWKDLAPTPSKYYKRVELPFKELLNRFYTHKRKETKADHQQQLKVLETKRLLLTRLAVITNQEQLLAAEHQLDMRNLAVQKIKIMMELNQKYRDPLKREARLAELSNIKEQWYNLPTFYNVPEERALYNLFKKMRNVKLS